jgi:hypothetical protein
MQKHENYKILHDLVKPNKHLYMLTFVLNKDKNADPFKYANVLDSIEENIKLNTELLHKVECKTYFLDQYKDLKVITEEFKNNLKNNIFTLTPKSLNILKTNEELNQRINR